MIGPDDSLEVQVELTNAGERPGTEVVQLYIQDLVGSTARPVRELRRFERVPLEPGESKVLTFTLQPEDLACLDRNLQPTVEPGDFKVYVGGSSVATLSAPFTVQSANNP